MYVDLHKCIQALPFGFTMCNVAKRCKYNHWRPLAPTQSWKKAPRVDASEMCPLYNVVNAYEKCPFFNVVDLEKQCSL